MPLTTLQRDVLAVLARQRSEESHFAGSVVLHCEDASARYSKDFDIFHDAESAVARSSAADVKALRQAGFEVSHAAPLANWEKAETSFRRASVRRGEASVEVDWALDSAYRYFPIERDPELGWRIHRFDAATNKALALASRSVTRDFVDILEYAKLYTLPALCWAACGKDLGYTPFSLLELMRRFARIDPAGLAEIQARALDPRAMKEEWTKLADAAHLAMKRIADEQTELPIGVAFVDANGHPGWIGDDPTLRIHAPSVRGCWPTIRGLDP
ncbi:MAG: hypothetical protein JNM84_00620 [Planctomycetes bacterium]|nr:hypothetical protein [Planctomycetota bacterium]